MNEWKNEWIWLCSFCPKILVYWWVACALKCYFDVIYSAICFIFIFALHHAIHKAYFLVCRPWIVTSRNPIHSNDTHIKWPNLNLGFDQVFFCGRHIRLNFMNHTLTLFDNENISNFVPHGTIIENRFSFRILVYEFSMEIILDSCWFNGCESRFLCWNGLNQIGDAISTE